MSYQVFYAVAFAMLGFAYGVVLGDKYMMVAAILFCFGAATTFAVADWVTFQAIVIVINAAFAGIIITQAIRSLFA